mmetsp:Transcript_29786/g.74901  ORF Transcript_29786/g.74901 Transcript_29786/m.74901 type:complete len:629 (-) Transcript_29786:9-1895(-)
MPLPDKRVDDPLPTSFTSNAVKPPAYVKSPAYSCVPCIAPATATDRVVVGTGVKAPTAPRLDPHNATLHNAGLQEDVAAIRRELCQLASKQELLYSSQSQLQSVVDSVHEGLAILLASSGAAGRSQEKDVDVVKKCGCACAGHPSQNVKCSHDYAEPPHATFIEAKVEEDFVPWDRIRSQGSMVLMPSADEEQLMLKNMFELTEAAEEDAIRMESARRDKVKYTVDRAKNMTKAQAEMLMDSVMGVIICLNAVFIGISMDHGENTVGWLLADSTFSIIFIGEIVTKLWLHGFAGHFCGPTRYSNCFDAFLVFVDLVQLSIVLVDPAAAANSGDIPSASLFRIVRLIKLTRLLRLLRSEVFKDLLSMIQGMLGGMTTLAWSMVLFFLMVYVLALLFRELLGRKEKENVYEFFDSVPRSMFTTFRCSFGDCSTAGGVPIFEYVQKDYGWPVSLFYCLFVFTVTIGLFNVISAIFVESTMVAAMALEASKRKARLQDERLWNSRITTLVRRIMDVSPQHSIPGKMSEAVDEIHRVAVNGCVIDEVVKDAAAIQALNDLDIDPEDHAYLSDILDPDNGGTIEICEFIDGLRRLRGEPRRSDIVSVDLMIRAMQKQIGDMHEKINAVHVVRCP